MGTCKMGGRGRLCTDNSTCSGIKRCSSLNPGTCSDVGTHYGSAQCTYNSDCTHRECHTETDGEGPSITCLESRTPGVTRCDSDQECQTQARAPGPKATVASSPRNDTEQLLSGLGGSVSLGSKIAPITMVMFQDLKCGMCRKAFLEIFPKLQSKFVKTNKVRFIFADLPLAARESTERQLAYGALCANKQGRHQELLSYVYSQMKDVDRSSLLLDATKIGLNTTAFKSCLEGQEVIDTVDKSSAIGQRLNVTGTPTFYINETPHVGVKPFEYFERMLEAELKRVSMVSKHERIQQFSPPLADRL